MSENPTPDTGEKMIPLSVVEPLLRVVVDLIQHPQHDGTLLLMAAYDRVALNADYPSSTQLTCVEERLAALLRRPIVRS